MASVKTPCVAKNPPNQKSPNGTTIISNVMPAQPAANNNFAESQNAYNTQQDPNPLMNANAANNANYNPRSNQQLYFSHTNIIVKYVSTAVNFYQNAFGWEVIKQSETAAVMQYKNYTFYIVSENCVNDYFGYSAVSPQTSGHSPSMTTTLLCDDVANIWNKALIAGAIPVKSPYTKSNGSTCATLVGPENYIWFITDTNNFFC